jgi:hypothetical protein
MAKGRHITVPRLSVADLDLAIRSQSPVPGSGVSLQLVDACRSLRAQRTLRLRHACKPGPAPRTGPGEMAVVWPPRTDLFKVCRPPAKEVEMDQRQ